MSEDRHILPPQINEQREQEVSTPYQHDSSRSAWEGTNPPQSALYVTSVTDLPDFQTYEKRKEDSSQSDDSDPLIEPFPATPPLSPSGVPKNSLGDKMITSSTFETLSMTRGKQMVYMATELNDIDNSSNKQEKQENANLRSLVKYYLIINACLQQNSNSVDK